MSELPEIVPIEVETQSLETKSLETKSLETKSLETEEQETKETTETTEITKTPLKTPRKPRKPRKPRTPKTPRAPRKRNTPLMERDHIQDLLTRMTNMDNELAHLKHIQKQTQVNIPKSLEPPLPNPPLKKQHATESTDIKRHEYKKRRSTCEYTLF